MTRGPRHARRAGTEAGFTLVEVLIAGAILLVGILGVLTLLDAANRSSARTKARDGATALARELIEGVRAVPYPDLTSTTIKAQLQAQPGLQDAAAGTTTWEIVRRGITYTVGATVCSVDDGTTDGYGDHTGGDFCADSATTGTADLNPDDYKRASVSVRWIDGTTTRRVRQEAVLNNPGSAFAPSVTSMTPSPLSPVTSPLVNSVAFDPVKTSSKAQSVRWYVDNIQRGTATASGNDWRFDWNLTGLVDGTYLVRGQAYDRYGQTGAGYVVTMVLNRYAPSAPTGFTGGRNPVFPNLVDLEWNPNPERDITGYEVYRVTGVTPNLSADTLVCSTAVGDASATACSDTNAPAAPQGYYVVALAPSRSGSGTERSAVPATPLNADLPNLAPTAPPSITATALTGGGVRLSWTASTDPDLTGIRYYRIYRDNATYAGRIDHTPSGTSLDWTDEKPGAANHRYWVTAVDNRMSESPLAPQGGIQP